LLLASLVLAGCSFNRPAAATPSLIAEAEAGWQASPTADYRITVEVERPDEARRLVVTVVDHEIAQGLISYYDFETRRWLPPQELNQEQAFAFTVPGLFDMVRGALAGCERDDIRVQMAGEPPFPQKIVLGPVIMDGEKIEATRSTVTVRQFDER
jgi:hypothetical protein